MCIYIWKRNLYVILLIEVSSACFMLLGFHVFWSIIERNKEIKGWGEGKERKFWDKNIFFLLIHGIEFQQKMNKILALTNDDTIQLIINTWIHFLHVSRAFIILYLKCLQPHNKHYISWAPRNAWILNYLNKIKTHHQYLLCLLQRFQGHTICYQFPEYQDHQITFQLVISIMNKCFNFFLIISRGHHSQLSHHY